MSDKFQMTTKQVDNFWVKVNIGEEDVCWNWLGGTNGKNGYGRFRIGKKKYGTHRVSFFLKNGCFPKALALHECDNPLCCNPKHISDGSSSKNIKDAYTRKRAHPKRGELNGNHFLTIDKVLEIKDSVGPQRKTAKLFGVSQRTVCAIKIGYLWSGALEEYGK